MTARNDSDKGQRFGDGERREWDWTHTVRLAVIGTHETLVCPLSWVKQSTAVAVWWKLLFSHRILNIRRRVGR